MPSEIVVNGRIKGKDINFYDFISKFNTFLSDNNVNFDGSIYFEEYTEAEIIE